MADRSSQLVLQALSRAAAEGDAVPLIASRSSPGLFPATQAGRQAAQRCCEEGLLQTTSTSTGSASLCTLTTKGREYLLNQVSPRQVLEDFVRVLESREVHVNQLVAQVRQMQTSLEAMRQQVAPILDHVRLQHTGQLNGLFREFHEEKTSSAQPADLARTIAASLERWSRSGAADDCPLPELFRQIQTDHQSTSIGAFHDALRRLEAEGRLYLYPWTGPLYAIPEPAYALLVGHSVAYYASLKKEG